MNSIDTLFSKLSLRPNVKKEIESFFYSKSLQVMSWNELTCLTAEDLKDLGLSLAYRKSFLLAIKNLLPLRHSNHLRVISQKFVPFWDDFSLLKIIGDFYELLVHVLTCLKIHLNENIDISQGSFYSDHFTHIDVSKPDEFYLLALDAKCMLMQRILDIELQPIQVRDGFEFGQDFYANIPQLKQYLSDILSELEFYIESYVNSLKRKPRLHLLFKIFKFTLKETNAFSYIVLNNFPSMIFSRQCKVFVSGKYMNPPKSMANLVAVFARFSPSEYIYFFSRDERLHLEQELFEPEDEFSNISSTRLIKLTPHYLLALAGGTLNAAEFYKIDKTAIADIILLEDNLDTNEDVNVTIAKSKNQNDQTNINCSDEVICNSIGHDDETSELIPVDSKQTDNFNVFRSNSYDSQTGQELFSEDTTNFQPYTTDLDYIQDNLAYIEAMIKAQEQELNNEESLFFKNKNKTESGNREFKAKTRALKSKVEKRLAVTLKHGNWKPKLVTLSEEHSLDNRENEILLILAGAVVSPKFRHNLSQMLGLKSFYACRLSVGVVISILCSNLCEQINARMYFYKNSKLVKNGLIQVMDNLFKKSNILDCELLVDRQMLDYIIGLETEIGELVDGSELSSPSINLNTVALPPEMKASLISAVHSHEKFQKVCREIELKGSSIKTFSKGLRMLFYGPPGTGKTMTSHALANYMGKKVLSIGLSSFPDDISLKDFLKLLFRECKIHNAILFFDECELLFDGRDHFRNDLLGALLTEIEEYDGIIILATNRPAALDEALHRRIQLSIAFNIPDYKLRSEIWKSHVPASMVKDIDWVDLACRCELTGGLIKNAVLTAISISIQRSSCSPLQLGIDDLTTGAKNQLRSMMEMCDFENRVIPTHGFESLVYSDVVMEKLRAFVQAGKSFRLLSTQWGFGNNESDSNQNRGLIALISGEKGVGKTTCAHTIAYELGQPLKVANVCELLAHGNANVNKHRSLTSFFKSAKLANALILLEDADPILTISSQNSANIGSLLDFDLYALLYQIYQYEGPLIITSKLNVSLMENYTLQNIRFVIELARPTFEMRCKLWQNLIPKSAPLKGDFNFSLLAREFELNGGGIRVAINIAAERAASRIMGDVAITHDDFLEAAKETLAKYHYTLPNSHIYQ